MLKIIKIPLTLQHICCKIKKIEMGGSIMIIHNYESSSGKDLIQEYINSLTKEEQVDGFRVLELLEKGEMQKIIISDGTRKYTRYTF